MSYQSRLGRSVTAGLAVFACWLTGCQNQSKVSDAYGHSTGRDSTAVGGTRALKKMFQASGYRVQRATRLWPRLLESEVIVWIPDRFVPPTQYACDELERWLSEGNGRTLVYVGRDYDAVSHYLEQIQSEQDNSTKWLHQRHLARAKTAHVSTRDQVAKKESCQWFNLQRAPPNRTVGKLTGEPGWLKGVDGSKTDIRLGSKIEKKGAGNVLSQLFPAFQHKVFVKADDEALVASIRRPSWQKDRQILVVSNGSFLLNLPLVNPEHRQLTQNLIDHCGAGKTVVFLESGELALDIRDRNPNDTTQSGLEAFTVWPINLVIMHCFAIGIVYCFSAFPIFGRPKKADPEALADFGKHIDAIAELMAKTGDHAYVQARLFAYQNQVRGDSGSSKPRGQ